VAALLLFIAIRWIIVRSRMFTLRMSSYRNIRFGQTPFVTGFPTGQFYLFYGKTLLMLIAAFIVAGGVFALLGGATLFATGTGNEGGEAQPNVMAVVRFAILIYLLFIPAMGWPDCPLSGGNCRSAISAGFPQLMPDTAAAREAGEGTYGLRIGGETRDSHRNRATKSNRKTLCFPAKTVFILRRVT